MIARFFARQHPASGMSDGADKEPDTYSGVLGAFPYAIGRSESRLFRAYAVLAGLLTGLLAVYFTLGLIDIAAAAPGGGSISALRALVILAGLVVVMPVMGPVLLVARRHRHAEERNTSAPTRRYDRLMAATGFAFVAAAYLALVMSTPEELQSTPEGPFAPLAAALYDAPRVASPLPPVVVVVAMLVLDRAYGRRPAGEG